MDVLPLPPAASPLSDIRAARYGGKVKTTGQSRGGRKRRSADQQWYVVDGRIPSASVCSKRQQ